MDAPRTTRFLVTGLQAADWRIVARRAGEDGLNFFASQFGAANLLWREFRQDGFFFRSSRRFHAIVHRVAELLGKFTIDFAGIAAHPGAASRLPATTGRCHLCRVVQTLPSRRTERDAPALSSPPKTSEPSIKPSTNYLKPTGTAVEVAGRV